MEAPSNVTGLLDGAAPRPLVIAHRGASADAPDNSLSAFEVAIEHGADMVELDVRRTADGTLVAHHSARRRGIPLERLTYAELVRRSRYRPPRLDEVLSLCAGRVAVDVEVKEPGYEAAILEHVGRRMPMEHVLVTSFQTGVIQTIKSLRPDLSCGLVVGLGRLRAGRSGVGPAVVDPALACGADFVAIHQLLAGLRPHSRRRRFGATPVLHAAAEAKLPVAVWTVNGVPRLRHFLGDPLIAAVITDIPATAVELRRQLT